MQAWQCQSDMGAARRPPLSEESSPDFELGSTLFMKQAVAFQAWEGVGTRYVKRSPSSLISRADGRGADG